MSFHGGGLGVLAAIFIYCRIKKIPLLSMCDAISTVVPIGLFFGRVANYINAELVGRITDVPWATVFPGAGPLPRHPSQLYEAVLEGILLFSVLFSFASFKTVAIKRPGLLWGIFCAGYGISRCIVEFFREPEQPIGYMIGNTTLGQWLSFPLIIFGLILCLYSLKTPHYHERRSRRP
jgi:phosphatidylglycerol:prolipoprotein diacylglycerol transferase